MIKGGVWKNTEDEILKAAVMKYGLNQWARISSLLVRKSAKQCKARWYEWLDPSIKKTEWSQAEDEKLLHLAKIMPCQWRSIAPIVGRTAAQCLERYEHLLDAVVSAQQQGQADENDAEQELLIQRSSQQQLSGGHLRRLRPGEIDPHPETKPARPDAIDMDEDEKEMLSEARARLANTKGKKAKRKAREKQLEEARRLASLQKRRELKAAGIHLKKRRKRKSKYLDYNGEIPFYRQTPRGFWDTTSEDLSAKAATDKARAHFRPQFLSEVEGERRDDIEERERKKDVQRQKLLKKINLPELVKRLNSAQDGGGGGDGGDHFLTQRKQLQLPTPQISETELEEIAKLSQTTTTTNTTATTATTAASSSSFVTPNVVQQSQSNDVRTPSTTHARIVEQATNALRMQNTQTPLLGGENVALYKDDWQGVTPKTATTTTAAMTSTTTMLATPNINTPNLLASVASNVSSRSNVSMDGKKMRKKERKKRKRLRAQFEALPAAMYDYDIALPRMPSAPYCSDSLWIEDRAERDAQQEERALRLRQEAVRKQQSSVVQNALPRPSQLNPRMRLMQFEDEIDDDANDELLRTQMMDLVYFDLHMHDDDEGTRSRKKQRKLVVRTEEFEEQQLADARKLLNDELATTTTTTSMAEMEALEMEDEQRCVFVPRDTRYRYVGGKQLGNMHRLASTKQEFKILQQSVHQQQQRMHEMEQKLAIKMGGYDKIGRAWMAKNEHLRRRLMEMQTECAIFEQLKERELSVIPQRIAKWKQMIETEKKRQTALQMEYENIQHEHDSFQP